MHTIETAAITDLQAVTRLNAFLRIDVEGFYWDTAPYIEAAIREGLCFGIRSDREIRGCMIIERRPADRTFDKDHLAIGSLSVHPDYRNGNMGILLVDFAKALAREENKRLYVESFYEFRRTAFYESRGFAETARRLYRGKPYHVLYIDPVESR